MFFSSGGGGGRSAFLKTAQGLELFGNMLEQGNTLCQRGGGGRGRSDSRVPLVVRERAVARSRFATGAVTMTTRHSTAFRSYVSGDV